MFRKTTRGCDRGWRWGTTLGKASQERWQFSRDLQAATCPPGHQARQSQGAARSEAPLGSPLETPTFATTVLFPLSWEELFEEEEKHSNEGGLWLCFAFSTGSNTSGEWGPVGTGDFHVILWMTKSPNSFSSNKKFPSVNNSHFRASTLSELPKYHLFYVLILTFYLLTGWR